MKLQPRTLHAQAPLGGNIGIASPVTGFLSDGGVVLRERADIGCVLLTAAVDIPEAASVDRVETTSISNLDPAATASKVAQVTLPRAPGSVTTTHTRTALWLSPRSWLIHCAVDEEANLVSQLNAAFPDKLLHAVPFTDALCWLELSGEGALDLLQEGGFLSLERDGLAIGHAKRTLLAQVAVIIFRASQDAWLVGVERSRARYFVTWLTGCARSPAGFAPTASQQTHTTLND